MADRPVLSALILGLLVGGGILGSGALVARGVVNARTGARYVTVHGLSERIVRADVAILPLRFTESGDALEQVQDSIDHDTSTVRAFLAARGYAAADVDLGKLEVTDRKAQQYQANNQTGPRFIVGQTVIVRTADVARVQDTSRKLADLVREGVVLQNFQGPSYIFDRINDVRPAMIADATASARKGAEQFARDSGAQLGGIKAATQGSFEILARDEFSGNYGAFNQEASPEKRLRVVTNVTYALR